MGILISGFVNATGAAWQQCQQCCSNQENIPKMISTTLLSGICMQQTMQDISSGEIWRAGFIDQGQ